MTTTIQVSVNGTYQRQVIISGVAATVGPDETKIFTIPSMVTDVRFTYEELVAPNVPRNLEQELINETRDETHPMGATESVQTQPIQPTDEEARSLIDAELSEAKIDEAAAEARAKADAAAAEETAF